MNNFPHHAFREYDIRGIAGSDITEEFAYRLGLASASLLAKSDTRPVIVGRDVRLSGPALMAAAIEGVRDKGRDVVDIGMVPTPLAYFAVYHLNAAGCIQITASHNPAEYNGFKLMRDRESLHGEHIQILKRAMLRPLSTAPRRGDIRQVDVNPAYQTLVNEDCRLARPLKVVIDAGNGPAGIVAGPLYRRLGCDVVELYCEPDGRFPNHHPDPTIEANMQDLAEAVVGNKADLGIAFDGDGDRIGVVDEHGHMIWGDMLLLLLSRHLLKAHPGATIISEVKSSEQMYRDIIANGGHPIMWRTGHSPIKAKMKATGALLAGEMSGHIFFADRYFGFDDAVYAGARLMQVLAEHSGPISSLLADVPHAVCTPEIRIDCPDERKFALVEEAKIHFLAEGYDIIDVDGIRISLDDGWGLLRASNTQPGLVMRFEAQSEQRLREIRQLIEGWLKDHA